MTMAKVKTGVERHYCAFCEEMHEGLTTDFLVLDVNKLYNELPSPELIKLEDFDERKHLWTKELYTSPHCGESSTDRDEMQDYYEVWLCGDCGTEYRDSHAAAECCE